MSLSEVERAADCRLIEEEEEEEEGDASMVFATVSYEERRTV